METNTRVWKPIRVFGNQYACVETNKRVWKPIRKYMLRHAEKKKTLVNASFSELSTVHRLIGKEIQARE